MVTDKNIVRKQTVNFQYNGNTDGFALQKEVSDWCRLMLIPEIEQQLELFDLGDNYITIDKLAIDATVDKKDWQQKIRNELIFNLSRKLQDYKAAPDKKPDEQKSEARSHKLDELILFYFEKGYLPWWSKAFVENNFDTVLYNWIQEKKSQARIDAIIFKLQQINSVPVIQRIVNLVPVRLYFTLLQHIFKKETDIVAQAESFLSEILKSITSKTKQKTISIAFYEVLLAMLIKNNKKADVELSRQVFQTALKNETPVIASVLKTATGKSGLSANRFAKAWQNISSAEIKDSYGKHSEETKKENEHIYHRAIDQLTNKAVEKNSMKGITEDLREGIYIENAGAVVIAAFLPRLFERLKIIDKAEIINPGLGALMIQYAVSGKTKAEEHELVLPKILCGINPELPVNTARKITRAQQSEADEMLRAVIEHWSAIKNTSVEGLRESFLKRNGKLMLAEDEWLLQAEQKAYDMLLQQLPWNISMIKLPWMKNLLKTEWV